jgi:hypothetical protein
MKYALKGTDEEWANALKDKDGVDGSTVQIRRTQEVKTPKRKADDATALENILKSEKGASGGKGKKSKSKKKSRKTIG